MFRVTVPLSLCPSVPLLPLFPFAPLFARRGYIIESVGLRLTNYGRTVAANLGSGSVPEPPTVSSFVSSGYLPLVSTPQLAVDTGGLNAEPEELLAAPVHGRCLLVGQSA